MGKIRRGNYQFISWAGDHGPKHVHVFRDQKLVLKWDVEGHCPMEGKINKRILKALEELIKEGKL